MDSEWRFNIPDSAPHARDTRPQQQRESRGQFRPAGDESVPVEFGNFVVHAPAEHERMNDDQKKQFEADQQQMQERMQQRMQGGGGPPQQ